MALCRIAMGRIARVPSQLRVRFKHPSGLPCFCCVIANLNTGGLQHIQDKRQYPAAHASRYQHRKAIPLSSTYRKPDPRPSLRISPQSPHPPRPLTKLANYRRPSPIPIGGCAGPRASNHTPQGCARRKSRRCSVLAFPLWLAASCPPARLRGVYHTNQLQYRVPKHSSKCPPTDIVNTITTKGASSKTCSHPNTLAHA